MQKVKRAPSVGARADKLTDFEKSICGIRLKAKADSSGYTADVKVPLSADSYMPVALEAPTQTSMMELIRVVLFKKFRGTGLD